MKLPSVFALAVASIIGTAAPPAAFAHPGGLNAEGCHNNRKTGGYHCHRSGSSTRNTGVGVVSRSRSFRNCAAARAAGAAPVRRGEPGYGAHLDRDNDGVGCEPNRGQ